MGFNFRKKIKIAPGLSINLGKRGASVSVGRPGATVNLSGKGAKATVGIPGTGISYSTRLTGGTEAPSGNAQTSVTDTPKSAPLAAQAWDGEGSRSVGIWLGSGIFLMPYLFSWLLLRSGYSKTARYLAFSWLVLIVFIAVTK